jgi:phage baseplate assembly protein W
MDETLHLAIPFRIVNGAYATRQQDSDAEASDCVRNILAFEKGSRIEDPDFGIEDPSFESQPIDVDDIAEAIATYEPRVNAEIETEDEVEGTSTVSIFVTLPTSDDLPEEA